MTIFIERRALLHVLESSAGTYKRHAPIDDDDEWVEVNRIKEQRSSDIEDCFSVGSSEDDDSSCESCDRRRVSFSDTLISEVHYRPRTPPSEVQRMYYSPDETNRFRQEYRMERKLMMELDMDMDSSDTDLSNLFADSSHSDAALSRHISRVLILHNDKIETLSEVSLSPNDGAIFDNESFWSGSITWF